MKNETKFTKEYRKKLISAIGGISQYLQSKTGFFIRMDTELDPANGFIYSVKISLDGKFSKYAKWCVLSTTKQSIKKELLEKIANFDFNQNKKHGGTTKKTIKQVKSSAREIECISCGDIKPIHSNFHRNIHSPLFKEFRGGYSFCCFDCLYARALEIERQSDFELAVIFICGVLDRPIIRSLVETVKTMDMPPIMRYSEYLRRLNLVSNSKRGGCTFASSDLFTSDNQF